MNQTDPQLRRNRMLLVAIFALFFIPLLLAMLMRSEWWDFTPPGTTNAGRLLEPAVPLQLDGTRWLHGDAEGVRGKWLLMYIMTADCDQSCEQQVTTLRQLHKATGRNQDRVAVLLLANPAPAAATVETLANIYDNFHVAAGSGGDAFSSAVGTPRQVFIVDPAANIILAYGADFVAADINGDLKRLLKYSAQGNSS